MRRQAAQAGSQTDGKVRMQSRSIGAGDNVFTEAIYTASKWPHRRQITIKAEIVREHGHCPTNNSQLVIGNLYCKSETVYQICRGKGEAENRVKEPHHVVKLHRTSCTNFCANPFRVLMKAAACSSRTRCGDWRQTPSSPLGKLRRCAKACSRLPPRDKLPLT